MASSAIKPALPVPVGGDSAALIGPPGLLSRTVKYWGKTMLISLGLIAAAQIYHTFEIRNLRLWPYERMFDYPATMAMMIFGWPHFIIAIYFMTSSRRMQNARGWAWITGLTCVGIVMAFGFRQMGGMRNPVMLILFYTYFLVHAYRDEALFYRMSGDRPNMDEKTQDRLATSLQVIALATLLIILMPVYLYFQERTGQLNRNAPLLSIIYPSSVSFPVIFGAYLGVLAVINTVVYFVTGRRYPGGWFKALRQHRPLVLVFVGANLILFTMILLGTWVFSYVVLAHFIAWYFFAVRKLKTAPPGKPARNLSVWFRTTVPGFRVLHFGMVGVVVVLLGISAYVFNHDRWLNPLIGETTFYYFTILHVTMSWVPR